METREHGAGRAIAIAGAVALTIACENGALGLRGTTDGSRADASAPDARVTTDAGFEAPDAEGCASSAFMAETTRRPIDIVIWVDDGGSFSGARAKVASSIGVNLAEVLDAASVDYRVILMSRATAIPAPLGTDPERFVHLAAGYSAGGGGFVFFSGPTYLPMYRPHLRDGAFRVFLSATDCENAAGTFEDFEEQLAANGTGAFVVGDDRNFVYNMIGNVALKTPGTTPWSAGEAVAGRGSYSGYTNCANPQQGAIATGGVRLGVAAENYDELFQTIAEASVLSARLPCSFDPPEGEPVDLDYVRFRYSPGGDASMEQELHRVELETDCDAEGGFYESEGRLVLCPSTCDLISSDPEAAVRFTYECTPF